jgi:hypothetical protein
MTPQKETFLAAAADLRDHVEAHGCVRCQALLLTMIEAMTEWIKEQGVRRGELDVASLNIFNRINRRSSDG